MAGVAAMRAMNPTSLMDRMGIEVLEASSDRLVATMPVEGNTQPYGLLHGGASVVLAESLGSIGAALHAGPGKAVVGLDINATHHRAARSGLVTGVATPISLGRTLACYEVVVSDDGGRRLCTSRITCLIRDGAPGA
ncbi:MAG TPA: hotdog fold thioesterase [Ornithinibacter sp.]|nr:hotdog fold thioesterase [Ornithinibacter sp.]